MITHRRWHWVAITGALAALCVIAVGSGAISIPAREVIDAIRGNGDPMIVSIVRNLRMPRVLLGALVGAGLGMSGGALQGTLRNGLAEPYLLGVSGGAAVGAVIAFAAHVNGSSLIALAAFAGAALAVVLALLVARAAGVAGRGDPRTLLMAGVVIGAFANAVIMIALANAPANTVRGALWWMMGSVGDASWNGVASLALYIAIGGGALIYWAREIDVLSLGDEPAAALGVNVETATRRIYLLAALLAAATVAAAGLIGFVGLIVPHIVRAGGIRKHRPLIGGSAIVGATLVVAADLVARTIRPPGELPLGAVTAVLGVPFFLGQLRRAR
ncbi:MAG TPA: iron ABC transporter permease [Gemmatimonadaceae bacterium]|nr:iron ABC transporter permease [Gemmatimonadaceae bacterium]